MKRLLLKLYKSYLLPFLKLCLNWRFLLCVIIPFAIVDITPYILVFLGAHLKINSLCVVGTSWIAILLLPFCHEKIIVIPIAILLHSIFFANDKKTKYQLLRVLVSAKKDFSNFKNKLRRKNGK